MFSFVRHSGRYREIAMALGRHGFGFMAEGVGLTRLLPRPFHRKKVKTEARTLGERIRLVLEELGPTFVKVGQLASTRTDLLPESITRELVKLQDQVPPFSAQEARQILEDELQLPVEDLLGSFNNEPLAAASIGQVHEARLTTGERVAIKIQRPGVVPVIERDLDILKTLTVRAQKRWTWVSRYQIPQMVDEFSRSIRSELDYSLEGRNMEKIGSQFKEEKGIYIPNVFWQYTTSKVLTMDFVEGLHLSRLPEIKQQGVDPKDLAHRLVYALLHQIFDIGLFHADPHPGNLLVTPSGDLAFIDFGMAGRLSNEMKDHLASLVISLMKKNSAGMVRAILRMGLLDEGVDMAGLKVEMEQLRDRYYDTSFAQIRIGEAINDLFGVAQRHNVIIPADLLLLGKALITVEGVALSLDPELRILDMAEPFGQKLLKERYGPRRVRKKLIDGVIDMADSLSDLPQQVRNLSMLISKGKMRVEMDLPELEHFLRKLDQISNRVSFSIVLLSFSIIMVGLIIGSSLARMPTMLWKFPAIEIGSVVATLMFLWLLYSIYKSGKF